MKTFPVTIFLVLLIASSPHAAVIYSGVQNITIPGDLAGVYLNLDNASHSSSPILGWDVNPFYGGSAFGYESSFLPVLIGTGAVDDPIARLYTGDMIGASAGVGRAYATGFGGSGFPVPHMGGGAGQFQNGVPGFIGFKFTTDGNAGPFFGWMRVTLTDASVPGVITDWAWEDSGASILAGAVPEPGRAMLLLLGMQTLLLRRRRR